VLVQVPDHLIEAGILRDSPALIELDSPDGLSEYPIAGRRWLLSVVTSFRHHRGSRSRSHSSAASFSQ
jgi:hypothetical protein